MCIDSSIGVFTAAIAWGGVTNGLKNVSQSTRKLLYFSGKFMDLAEGVAFEPKHQLFDIALFYKFPIHLCVTLCVAVCVTFSHAKFGASGGSR